MLYTNADKISCNFCSESRGEHIVATGVSAEDSRVKAEEVKAEWKSLWQGCIDDKVQAEGMADRSSKKINSYVFSGLRLKRLTAITM